MPTGMAMGTVRQLIVGMCAVLVALAAFAVPASAQADRLDFAARGLTHHCIASIANDADLREARTEIDWNCDPGGDAYADLSHRNVLRFAIGEGLERGDGEAFFMTRRSPFTAIDLMVEDADGTLRSVSYRYDELEPAMVSGLLRARMPAITDATHTAYVAVDGAINPLTFARAEIARIGPDDDTQDRGLLMVMSFLCGMLVMPLLFSTTFFRVLRQSFVLWHTLLGVSLLSMIVIESGLSGYFVELTPSQMDRAVILLTGVAIASAAMFARGFIEEHALHRMFRMLLSVAALWSLLVSAAMALAPEEWRFWHLDFYYWAYLPVLWLFVTVLVDGLLHGSRAAKYQLVGWAPLLLAGAMRLISQLTDLVPPTDVMLLFYVGCVVQMLATTMGVVDAFMGLRHQRDDALSEAMMIEKRSERDPLTGLYNRGFLEDNFARLHADGFTSLAVVDLDFFKDINDTYGHATGDEVLRAVARALERKLDVDTCAIRMGGEEFVLLLRGDNAAERAEKRRRQIPRVVADLVELKRSVTASMGLVVAPAEVGPLADFDALYTYADKLLYRAKENGRDRLVSEKLSSFGTERRAAA